jgi:PTS system nitrogen regulatory IIA component
MKLSSVLLKNLVIKGGWKTKEEMLNALFKALMKADKKKLPHADIKKAVEMREKIGGTLLPSGLAMPHARLDGFDDFVLAVAIPEAPVKTPDGTIRLMTMYLTSLTANTLYLNCMAAFTRLSRDEKIFSALCAASPQDFIALIKKTNIEVTSVVTASNLMVNTPVTLHPGDSLRDAINLFYESRLGYLPVADSSGDLVGELTILDLFSLGIPAYALELKNMKYVRDFDPFKDLLGKENVILVKDIMKAPEVLLDEDATLMEVIMTLTGKKRRFLPVCKNRKLLGVVSYLDILEKALRG